MNRNPVPRGTRNHFTRRCEQPHFSWLGVPVGSGDLAKRRS